MQLYMYPSVMGQFRFRNQENEIGIDWFSRALELNRNRN